MIDVNQDHIWFFPLKQAPSYSLLPPIVWLLIPWSWKPSRTTCSLRSYKQTMILKSFRSICSASEALISMPTPCKNWSKWSSSSKASTRTKNSQKKYCNNPPLSLNRLHLMLETSNRSLCRKIVWLKMRWRRVTHSILQPRCFISSLKSNSYHSSTGESISNARMYA